jgi:hypothetical protein
VHPWLTAASRPIASGATRAGRQALERVAALQLLAVQLDHEMAVLECFKDAAADAGRRPTSSQPRSVASGRTGAQLAKAAATDG